MIRGGLKKTTTLSSIPSSCGTDVEDHVVSATSPFRDEISRQGGQAQDTSDNRSRPKEEEGDTPRDIALT